jgi:hypothetical protein
MKVSTHKQRNTLMKHVLEANGNKMAAAIQKQHILDGLGRRAQNPSAARHFLTTMRRMCVWAVAQKILPVDPTEGIKAPKPAAGLTNQSAHGLRKAAANVAAKNGATEAELDAIFWLDRSSDGEPLHEGRQSQEIGAPRRCKARANERLHGP